MGVAAQLRRNWRDLRDFGPRFLGRHLSKLRGRQIHELHVPGVGTIAVRLDGSDLETVRQVFAGREYELRQGSPAAERLLRRYRTLVAEGRTPVIVDAGANIGSASLWFRTIYPEAAIVAVEPEPGNVALLRRNLDGRPGFVVLPAAIGSASGSVGISNGASGWGARTARAETGVPVVTVAEAVASVPNGAAFIVKIDIEGFEADLFAGNLDWIDDAYAIFIEPHDWMLPGQGTSRNFQRAMAAHDFELLLCGENLAYVRI